VPEFSHMDEKGQVRMVDVSEKAHTQRTATARAVISMNPDTFEKIVTHTVRKGNVLETARIAGILAAKKTSELIPLCHPIHIQHIQIDFAPEEKNSCIDISATIRSIDQTGVEMEAMIAVSVAALTIYDMCKSHDRAMVISDIRLVYKSGGKSGTYVRKEESRSI
jgi:cyclic pyranopterin monophosphate synthase